MENDKKQKHHKNHDIGSSQKRRGGGCVSEKSMTSWTTSVGKDLQKEKKKKKPYPLRQSTAGKDGQTVPFQTLTKWKWVQQVGGNGRTYKTYRKAIHAKRNF